MNEDEITSDKRNNTESARYIYIVPYFVIQALGY
jgi:hypothetical protein